MREGLLLRLAAGADQPPPPPQPIAVVMVSPRTLLGVYVPSIPQVTGNDQGSTESQRRAIREMADPVRWRAYMLLQSLGPMRAAPLARMVGVSTVVMQRHLDVMGGLGLVATREASDGRKTPLWERVVPASGTALRVEAGSEDRAYAEEVNAWMSVLLSVANDLLTQSVATRLRQPAEWQAATEMQDYVLRLTREELSELGERLGQVVADYIPRSRQRAWDADPDTKSVFVATYAVLYPDPEAR